MATNLYAFKSSQAAGSKILPPENITVINGDFTISGNLQINGNINTTGNISATGNITANGTIMGSNTSHVGMIIYSTKLDNMQDVINIYGGTTWIQHSGYFLYGATSGVSDNNAVSDGGYANAAVIGHTHTYSGTTGNNNVGHYHGTGSSDGLSYFTMTSGGVTDDEGSALSGSGYDYPRRAHSSKNTWGGKTSTGTQSANHTHTFSGTTSGASGAVDSTNRNMPPYKKVYIWERTA